LYLLFPNDDQLSTFGFGPPGARLLIGDVFFFFTVVCAFKKLKYGFSECVKIIGWFPLILFLGSFAYSVMRGLPEFFGGAIGDSRWFCSIVLMPIGYLIYDQKYLNTIKKIFISVAAVHSIMVVLRYLTGGSWDTGGDVIRFAAGRPSLIISIGCVCLFSKELLGKTRLKISLLQCGLLVLFLLALVLGQTRTVFIMFPVAFVLIMWCLNMLRIKSIAKVVSILVLVAVVGTATAKILFPDNIQNSLFASLTVISEVFDPRTFKLIFLDGRPNLTAEGINASNVFSQSGNTYFRVLAWSQVIASISEYPGGWLVGLPMGTPFTWYGTGAKLYENVLPHNDYLVIISRVGFIGFVGYLLILTRFFYHVRRFSKCLNQAKEIPETLALIIVVLMYLLLFVLLNAEIRAYASHFWVWLLIGLGIRAIQSSGKRFSVRESLVRRFLRQVCKQPSNEKRSQQINL
jgi:O-antigen ligase